MHLADFYPRMEHSPLNLFDPQGNLHPIGKRQKVCIYGAGLGRNEAPLDDPEWDVWALNLVVPRDSQSRLRADMWFDIHQRVAQSDDDMRWLALCPFPLIVPDDLVFVNPKAQRYPIEKIEAVFGGYWACTFAYQIALALVGGYTDIGLYGVELAWGTARERTVEWACVSYWVGRAEERGVTIHLPNNSTLGCHVGRYGLEYKEECEAVRAYTDTCGFNATDKFGVRMRDEVPVYEKIVGSVEP